MKRPASRKARIKGNRGSRLRIEYETTADGSARRVELPFVIGIMANLSGSPVEPRVPVEDRHFETVDLSTFDAWMASKKPRLAIAVPDMLTGTGQLSLELTFKSMDDFAPAGIARQHSVLRWLLRTREHLSSALCDADGHGGVSKILAGLESMHAEIDSTLSPQINTILHHPSFRELEATWRGIHFLLCRTQAHEKTRIRVMDISKEELSKTLLEPSSPSLREICGEDGELPDEPYGCILGDYYFDHSPNDVRLLGEMSKTAAAAQAPFIVGAAPSVFNMESFQELPGPRSLGKIFGGAEYAAWNALRYTEDARFLALTLPRVLARPTYGARTQPVPEFSFEEDISAGEAQDHAWTNSVYALGSVISRSVELHGLPHMICGAQGGGAVDELPTIAHPSEFGDHERRAAEIAISSRREAELAMCGFVALVMSRGTDCAVFFSARSLRDPPEFLDPDATASEALGARLPYVLLACRFAHYLRCIERDRFVGGASSRGEIERRLSQWLIQYVTPPEAEPTSGRVMKPFTAAEISLHEMEDNPGHYLARLTLGLHEFQDPSVKLSLRFQLRSM